eukprot:TRINITY_DN7405_c0_g2_i2.p1 TRINITY_DN7405_c0_g2~~TRINITY_DN7405_c0_g2_i2.p1  ORF type:complete len:222 (-),score=34.69 TRINITY_DN7405_c0_g2_i2:736-1401(-)
MVPPPPPALARSTRLDIAMKMDEPENYGGLSRSHSDALSVSSECRSTTTVSSVSEDSDIDTISTCEPSSSSSSSGSSTRAEEDKEKEQNEASIKEQIASLMSRSPEHFQGRSAQDVYNMMPTDKDGSLTSVGSVLHASGSCMPCLFFYASTCNKGVSCGYCHVPHEDVKKKRSRVRREEARLHVAVTDEVTKLMQQRNNTCTGSGLDSDAQSILRGGRLSL